MRQTLFSIPREIFGWPVFGFGWLLGIWAFATAIVLTVQVRRHGWGPETRGFLPSIALSAAAIFLAPYLMDDSGLPIRGYGVMLLVAISSAIALAVYRARQVGLDPEVIFSLGMWLFVSGILGARVFYVAQFWEQFQQKSPLDTLKMIANFTQGGLVIYGAVLGGVVALAVFVYKYRLPGLALADLIAPSVILGMGLGRIGCFFTGCCWGGPCELPWAVTFPWGSPPHIDQAERGAIHLEGLVFAGDTDGPPVVASVEPNSPAARHGLKSGDQVEAVGLSVGPHPSEPTDSQTEWIPVATVRKTIALLELARPGSDISLKLAGERGLHRWVLEDSPPRSGPVHPTQIYSAIDALLLCLVLLAYSPFRRRNGELVALFFTLHSISRFLLEVLRREPKLFGTGLSIGQQISLVLLVGALALWGYVLTKPAGIYRFS